MTERKEKRVQRMLRIERDMYELLEILAKEDDRSINSYINRLIKKDIQQKQKEGKL